VYSGVTYVAEIERMVSYSFVVGDALVGVVLVFGYVVCVVFVWCHSLFTYVHRLAYYYNLFLAAVRGMLLTRVLR
jgi:hypothetical protein